MSEVKVSPDLVHSPVCWTQTIQASLWASCGDVGRHGPLPVPITQHSTAAVRKVITGVWEQGTELNGSSRHSSLKSASETPQMINAELLIDRTGCGRPTKIQQLYEVQERNLQFPFICASPLHGNPGLFNVEVKFTNTKSNHCST